MIDVPRLLEVLGVEAKRKGRDLWAPCPYLDHKDDEPSWHITDNAGSPEHGLHHCFGCKQGGSAVDLVMAKIGTSYPSAKAWLSENGIETSDLPSVAVALELGQRRVRPVFEMPPGVIQGRPPCEWPVAIRRYAESRGITAGQIERWRIGYAVDGRLAGRVVFPFYGEDMALESYSARTFVRGNKTRFLTPSEREEPNPDAVFGCQHWPKRGERDVVVVTEGAIDALACERVMWDRLVLHRIGIAALSGSSLSLGQADRLASFERILIATDPDMAGRAVAEAIAVLSRWRRVAMVGIEKGKDAQSTDPLALALLLDEAEASTW